MMRKLLLIHLFILSGLFANARRISGTVTDMEGKLLPYASIYIKGTARGTSANSEGKYFLDLEAGNYTLVCQYVGYQRAEKKITIGNENLIVDFQLPIQQLTLGEVIIKNGEDPAYAIIRQAIAKRAFYLDQLDRFQCEVYTKGQLRLRDFPKKFLGEKVDFEDGDTSKRKMLYLSESIATYSIQKPNKVRIEVTSTKVSGQSDAFGLSAPQIYSFYENNIKIGNNLNPRGFISPISTNALNYYRYKLEGSFFEDGREIDRIRVTPKRIYEPLFSGYINIVADDWRIHSVNLKLTKESQMELIDTLKVEQLYVPLTDSVWVVKSQVIYPSVKMFGFDAYGSFANVYSKFNLDPPFTKNFFDHTILKYEDSSNKKTTGFWEEARPLPLQQDEINDYRKKDSLENARKDPHYLDSLDHRRNKLSINNLLLTGHTFSSQRKRSSVSIPSLLEIVKYNTVEGLVINPDLVYAKRIDSGTGRKSFTIRPDLRYGFSNHHFNAFLAFTYSYGKKYFRNITISGGKRVFQFNNASLQGERGGTYSALYYENNRRKIYEAWFGRIKFNAGLGDGFNTEISFQYQDRIPLVNTTTYTWHNRPNHEFTPNYPEQFMGPAFTRHQAFIGSFSLSWHPGNRYIEFPGRKIGIGSKYPTFSVSFIKGFKNIMGSDIDYSKWRFAVAGNYDLKLAGRFNYSLSTGGFLGRDSVQIPDYFHLNGNLSVLATNYLSGFQLIPHYKYSNKSKLTSLIFTEYHLNGFLTNKIPGFRRLNWHLVMGSNSFFINGGSNYTELFAGFENIFKLIRVDFVQGFLDGNKSTNGIRISVRGFTGGRVDD